MKKLELEATFFKGQVWPLVKAGLGYSIKHRLTKLIYTFWGVEEVEGYPHELPRFVTIKVKWPNGKVHRTYTFQGYFRQQIGDCVQFEIVQGTMTMS